jgi:hypothetical protein
VRLRPADWLMLLSAIAVAVTLGLDWFTTPDGHETGWSSLGWVTLGLTLLTVALGLATVVLIAVGARDAVSLPPGVFLAALIPFALIVTLVVTLLKPGSATEIDSGAWIGLIALASLKAGAWLSIRDERVDQPSRHVEPPPARPAPPAA